MKFRPITLAVGLISIIIILSISGCFVSNSNSEVDLRNEFTKSKSFRIITYEKIHKAISGKAQIAIKNDSSFQNIVNIQMNGQKDNEGLVMKWIQQSNPAATFTEVSSLYKDLSRAVEAFREEFADNEKNLARIKKEHDNLLDKFPGSIIFSILGRKHLEYQPIISDATKQVFETGIDNNDKIFN